MSEPLELDDQVVSRNGKRGVVIGFDHNKTMVQIQWHTVPPFAAWKPHPDHGLHKLEPKPEPAKMIDASTIERLTEVEGYALELGISLNAAINRLINVGLGQPGCGATSSSGYYCTLPASHDGAHRAYQMNSMEPIDEWSDRKPAEQYPGFDTDGEDRPQHNPACLLVDGHDGDCINPDDDTPGVPVPVQNLVGYDEVDTVGDN